MRIDGDIGSLFVVSVYCKFNQSLGDYLDFLAELVGVVGSSSIIVGMDARAISTMWHSKMN